MGWRLLERVAHRPEWQIVVGLGQVLVLGLFAMAVGRRALRNLNHPTTKEP